MRRKSLEGPDSITVTKDSYPTATQDPLPTNVNASMSRAITLISFSPGAALSIPPFLSIRPRACARATSSVDSLKASKDQRSLFWCNFVGFEADFGEDEANFPVMSVDALDTDPNDGAIAMDSPPTGFGALAGDDFVDGNNFPDQMDFDMGEQPDFLVNDVPHVSQSNQDHQKSSADTAEVGASDAQEAPELDQSYDTNSLSATSVANYFDAEEEEEKYIRPPTSAPRSQRGSRSGMMRVRARGRGRGGVRPPLSNRGVRAPISGRGVPAPSSASRVRAPTSGTGVKAPLSGRGMRRGVRVRGRGRGRGATGVVRGRGGGYVSSPAPSAPGSLRGDPTSQMRSAAAPKESASANGLQLNPFTGAPVVRKKRPSNKAAISTKAEQPSSTQDASTNNTIIPIIPTSPTPITTTKAATDNRDFIDVLPVGADAGTTILIQQEHWRYHPHVGE